MCAGLSRTTSPCPIPNHVYPRKSSWLAYAYEMNTPERAKMGKASAARQCQRVNELKKSQLSVCVSAARHRQHVQQLMPIGHNDPHPCSHGHRCNNARARVWSHGRHWPGALCTGNRKRARCHCFCALAVQAHGIVSQGRRGKLQSGFIVPLFPLLERC